MLKGIIKINLFIFMIYGLGLLINAFENLALLIVFILVSIVTYGVGWIIIDEYGKINNKFLKFFLNIIVGVLIISLLYGFITGTNYITKNLPLWLKIKNEGLAETIRIISFINILIISVNIAKKIEKKFNKFRNN